MPADKLVTMVNQIGSFFATQRGDAAAAVAAHIAKFWDPRMREAFLDHVRTSGGAGLTEVGRGAAQCLGPDAAAQRRDATAA